MKNTSWPLVCYDLKGFLISRIEKYFYKHRTKGGYHEDYGII